MNAYHRERSGAVNSVGGPSLLLIADELTDRGLQVAAALSCFYSIRSAVAYNALDFLRQEEPLAIVMCSGDFTTYRDLRENNSHIPIICSASLQPALEVCGSHGICPPHAYFEDELNTDGMRSIVRQAIRHEGWDTNLMRR